MTELFQFGWFADYKDYIGSISGIITIITAFVTLMFLLVKLLYKLLKNLNRKKYSEKISLYYTDYEIERATKYFVQTKCQFSDASDKNIAEKNNFENLQFKIIPYLIKKIFPSKIKDKFYMILADSGMGKTTFLINLYLKYSGKSGNNFSIVLIPLGYPGEVDQRILSINNKENTILLLDSLDEDEKAIKNYENRIDSLTNICKDFRLVIVTCRSQFFPSDFHLPSDTKIMKFGVDKGAHTFIRMYISPFSDKDVGKYLRNKYSFYHLFKRRSAKKIIAKSPNLKVRPMLLSFIDDLIQTSRLYKYPFQIYEELIKKWIERERSDNKAELNKFAQEVAINMYKYYGTRKGFYMNYSEINNFAKKHSINLSLIEMTSRSLLNRNSVGMYKFAHKTILEYFLALDAYNENASNIKDSFLGVDQAKTFYDEIVFYNILIPYFKDIKHGNFITNKGTIYDVSQFELLEGDIDLIVRLNLKENGLENILPLSYLKNLRVLDLSFNNIKNATALINMQNLNVVDLSFNKIFDVNSFSKIKSLKELYLRNNNIRILEPLLEMESAIFIDVGDNRAKNKNIKEQISLKCFATKILNIKNTRKSFFENIEKPSWDKYFHLIVELSTSLSQVKKIYSEYAKYKIILKNSHIFEIDWDLINRIIETEFELCQDSIRERQHLNIQ